MAPGLAPLVWRPVGWSGVGAQCSEGTFRPFSITLLNGDSATFHSADLPGMSEGEVTILCDNGALDIDPWDDICIPNQGGGGGIIEP